MGDGGWVFDLTGEDEGLGSARERSPRAPIVGGMRGGLPTEPSSGDGGKGRPLLKLLLRSRCCWPASADTAELEEPEGPGLNASCELEALAARSEEGSGRVRFQYGTNLVEKEDGSEGRDGVIPGEVEKVLTISLAGLELLVAASEEAPGAERGRGRGRLLLVGEVGEGDGKEETGCWVGKAIPELDSGPDGCNERVRDCGEVGTGVGPGVGRGGRNGGEVNWDGGPPGVGSGLLERPLGTGLVGGEEQPT
jgi:hypothetical protein